MEEFKKLGLSSKTIQALEKKGFTEPTNIQKKVIPLLLEGKKDVIGQSQTGTGKTASFALPILEKIKENSTNVQAIILTPTRELALQVAEEINSLKGEKKIRILSVYGGAPIELQRRKLREGVEIVVGTPGRVMDLQRRNSLKIEKIKYAILDEADEMLNMGFIEDIETILKNTPKDKSMLLFSATMPRPILKIAERYMKEYEFIEVEKAEIITKTVEQTYYDISARDRVEALRRIMDYYIDFHGIIFCNTKAAVDTLTLQLTKMEYSTAALHGDITQSQREKILQQFRKRYIKVLIATDVAARGIDVIDLTHVINYSLPLSPESYIHRIGRTGRAGKKGIAITLVIPSEKRKLNFIERVNKCRLIKKKLPSAQEIIKNKEDQVKLMIKEIIETDTKKSSKYDVVAEELLKEYKAEEVVSAILKYSLKNELNLNVYKEISEPKQSERSQSSGRDRFRGNNSNRGPRKKFENNNNRRRRDNNRSRPREKEGNKESQSRNKEPSKRNSEYKPKSRNESSKTKKRFDRKEKRDKKSVPRDNKKRTREAYKR